MDSESKSGGSDFVRVGDGKPDRIDKGGVDGSPGGSKGAGSGGGEGGLGALMVMPLVDLP